jgi:hypothetical protein
MKFNNSGNISAGTFNQVGGDQYNSGGQQGVATSIATAKDAAVDLRRVLASLPGRTPAAAEIVAHLDAIDAGIRSPEPDKGQVAQSLDRLTQLLSAVGAFIKTGAALVRPLHILAQWLGPLGLPILQLLPFAA